MDGKEGRGVKRNNVDDPLLSTEEAQEKRHKQGGPPDYDERDYFPSEGPICTASFLAVANRYQARYDFDHGERKRLQ